MKTSDRRWHIFFDTTEVSSWRILNPDLAAMMKASDAIGFVSTLVIEEVVFQRVRRFKSSYDKVRTAAVDIEGCVDLKSAPSDHELEDRLRREIKEKLPKWTREVATIGVTLEELLEMSKRRQFPFRGDTDPTGFHDAVILLSYIKFAAAQGLVQCVFVSSNSKDHSAASVRALASAHETRWVFLPETQDLVYFLKDPDLTQTVTEALNANIKMIEDYIRSSLLPDMLKSARERNGLKEIQQIERLEVRPVSAVLDPPLQDDGEGKVKFHTVVSLLVEGTTGPVEAWPGVTRETSGFFPSIFTIEGQAKVSLKRRQIVGKPTVTEATAVAVTV